MPVHVDFCLLGPLTVRCQDAIVPIARGRQRALLAALLLDAGTPVQVNQLIDALWGAAPPASARACLHNQVNRLRDGLGAAGARVRTEPGGYLMHVEPGELDVTRMQDLVASARAAARGNFWKDASSVAASAMLLWRGEPLTGVSSAALARRIPQLTEVYLQAVDVRLEAELNLGHSAEALAAYRIQRRGGEDARVVPSGLPAAVAHFTGRAPELGTLTTLLNDEARCIVISGIGGAGKSALAVRWAHQVARRFPDGQLYADLRGRDVLAGLLRSLGVRAQDIPPAENERAARYHGLLSGRKILVVLENAGDPGQVRPLLPRAGSSVTVVTSRNALAGLAAARLDLGPLSPRDSVSLLRGLIGERVTAEPKAATALTEVCARMPLALRLTAGMAAARPGGSIATLTGDLTDQQRRLERLDAGTDPQTNVMRHAYRQLDAASARAFRFAGLHPGRNLDRYTVAALAGCGAEQAGHVLDVLARAYLLQPAGSRRYGMHDPLREYSRGLAATHDGQDEERMALTRLLDFYLAAAAAAVNAMDPAERLPVLPEPATPVPVFTGMTGALAWLDAERDNLVAITALAAGSHWPGHATRLSATVFRYLDAGGHLAEATQVCGHARYAASRSGDRGAEATALLGLAIVDYRRDRYQQSARHLRQALARYRKAGDPAGEILVRAQLCLIDDIGSTPENLLEKSRRNILDLYVKSAQCLGQGTESSMSNYRTWKVAHVLDDLLAAATAGRRAPAGGGARHPRTQRPDRRARGGRVPAV
jgi:hypothetical protein